MVRFDNIRVPLDRCREAYAAMDLVEAIEAGTGMYPDKSLVILSWCAPLSEVWRRQGRPSTEW